MRISLSRVIINGWINMDGWYTVHFSAQRKGIRKLTSKCFYSLSLSRKMDGVPSIHINQKVFPLIITLANEIRIRIDGDINE